MVAKAKELYGDNQMKKSDCHSDIKELVTKLCDEILATKLKGFAKKCPTCKGTSMLKNNFGNFMGVCNSCFHGIIWNE